MSSKCADCKFWERWGTEFGGCRRLPPQVDFNFDAREAPYQKLQITITRSHKPVWPNTSQDDWCGELQPHPLPQEK